MFGLSSGIVFSIIQVLTFGDAYIHLGTILLTVCLFGIAVQKESDDYNNILKHIGNKLSMYVYIIHGAIMDTITLVENMIFKKQANHIFLYLKPVLIILISLFCAEILYQLKISFTANIKKYVQDTKL